MKTILSIDLDILMSPYCGIYNRYIFGDNRNKSWSDIKANFDITNFSINSDYKWIITNIIKTYQNKVDKIYLGQDHSTILTAINENNFAISDLNIINIDYHHDINYNISNKVIPNKITEAFTESAVSS